MITRLGDKVPLATKWLVELSHPFEALHIIDRSVNQNLIFKNKKLKISLADESSESVGWKIQGTLPIMPTIVDPNERIFNDQITAIIDTRNRQEVQEAIAKSNPLVGNSESVVVIDSDESKKDENNNKVGPPDSQNPLPARKVLRRNAHHQSPYFNYRKSPTPKSQGSSEKSKVVDKQLFD